MSLARFSVRQPVLVNLLAVAVVVLGGMALANMTREAYPTVPMGSCQVFVPFPGASAEEVEQLVSVPVEGAVSGVDGIRQLYTTSREGLATVWIDFDPSVRDVGRKVVEISSAIERMPDLPDGVDAPRVVERFVDLPALTVAVRGEVEDQVLRATTSELRADLSEIDGVRDVTATGIREPALFVDVDADRLAAHRLPLEAVASTLSTRGANVPAGVIDGGDRAAIVRGMVQLDDPEALSEVVLRPGPTGGGVRIADVANVHRGYRPAEISARVDGEAAVLLMVYKHHSADTIRISEGVHALLDEARGVLPKGIQVSVQGDTSGEVRETLDVVYGNAWSGLLLVLVVLWLFIGARNATMAGLGLPVALAGGILTMHLLGITISLLSLMALILCLGVIVDDAIILVENIYRHLENGASPHDAAIRGTSEVIWPVVSSTLTTCAAFLPLLMMTGVFGAFFSIIPKVVIAALVASLFEALIVLPSHMADFSVPSRGGVPETRWQRIARRVGGAVQNAYVRSLARFMVRPGWTLIAVYGLCALFVAAAVMWKDVVLLSDAEVETFDVRVRMPADSARAATDRVMREVEQRLHALGPDTVANVTTTVGFARTDLWTEVGDHVAMTTVHLKPRRSRVGQVDGMAVVARASSLLADVAEPEVLEVTPVLLGPPRGAPVAVRLRGHDLDQLAELAETLVGDLRAIPGVRDVGHDHALGKRELQVHVDEARAGFFGTPPAAVARWLRTAFAQDAVTTTRSGSEDVDVVVRLDESSRSNVHRLAGLRMVTPAGTEVALGEIADLRHGRSIATIRRRNRMRQITVTAQFDPAVTSGQRVEQALQMPLARLRVAHPDVDFELGGEFEQVQESLTSLFQAFVVAALLIYVILASQFRSFVQPLVVMGAIPLALMGVTIGFFVSGQPVGLIALVGVVGLAGIVVNDSLVLVEFMNTRRADGMTIHDAVLDAGRLRLRPIVITSVTTIAGLLPLSFAGKSAPLIAPMATAISWGLLFATVLTLYAVPCLYLIVDRIAVRLGRLLAPLRRWARGAQTTATDPTPYR